MRYWIWLAERFTLDDVRGFRYLVRTEKTDNEGLSKRCGNRRVDVAILPNFRDGTFVIDFLGYPMAQRVPRFVEMREQLDALEASPKFSGTFDTKKVTKHYHGRGVVEEDLWRGSPFVFKVPRTG